MSKYLFTSESVSAGHPDKVADQISDALLDYYLKKDKNAHVAIETFATTQKVIVAGEVKCSVKVFPIEVEQVIRTEVARLGYCYDNMGFDAINIDIINLIHEQSADIDQGVSRQDPTQQGAGDQGMMFGYATNETRSFMPMTWVLANEILRHLDVVRERVNTQDSYKLGPDAKAQITCEYRDDKPVRVHSILVSTMHSKYLNEDEVQALVVEAIRMTIEDFKGDKEGELLEQFFSQKNWTSRFLVNPTGRFVIGGPNGDTGLTGRKIIVDTYGGWASHGGGAFSGKDPSKVDRSAAYAARYIAKNFVAAGFCDRCQVQLAYAIGKAEPMSVNVNTFGTAHGVTNEDLANLVYDNFPVTPYSIISELHLKDQIYLPSASYGHFGDKSSVEYPWERTDRAQILKEDFYK